MTRLSKGHSVPYRGARGTVFTVGHSTHTIAEFVALLTQVAVKLIVDVRSIPRSRANPQFNADSRVLPASVHDE